jgi:uncharacterized damage-inducible protein DinB
MAKGTTVISSLLDLLDQAYDQKAWHGPNLRGALRGVSAKQAETRNRKGGHSIAELALHCAYWKYIVRRRLLQLPKGSFARKGSNWFKLPSPLPEEEWKAILQLLDQEHAELRETVASFPVDRLDFTPAGSKFSNLAMINGIAAHDLYHAGQIRMLKPLS